MKFARQAGNLSLSAPYPCHPPTDIGLNVWYKKFRTTVCFYLISNSINNSCYAAEIYLLKVKVDSAGKSYQ